MAALPPDLGVGGDLQWGMKNLNSVVLEDNKVDNNRKNAKYLKQFDFELEFHNGTHFWENGMR